MAALATAVQIRLRVQDIPTLADVTRAGDGTASSFLLPQRNLTTASAFVPVGAGGGTAWSATGATFNASGMVSFSGAISASSAYRLTYTYSVFGDDEIDHFLTVGGNVNGAAIEAVQVLLFDGLKRASWSSPDGSTYSDVGAIGLLKDLYDILKKEQSQAAIGGGEIASWSTNQELY